MPCQKLDIHFAKGDIVEVDIDDFREIENVTVYRNGTSKITFTDGTKGETYGEAQMQTVYCNWTEVRAQG